MQTQFLQRYAPHSLYLLFHPVDTGNPNYDFNNHLERFANRRIESSSVASSSRQNNQEIPHELTRHSLCTGNITRIDLESTQLVGGRVLGRVEIDLGPVDEAEQQYKILAVPYAQQQLNNLDNAIEFIRVIKQAVSAGVEADPRSLQIWASWAYREINDRHSQFTREHPAALHREIEDARADIIAQVLKELAILSMELTVVTSTNENLLLDEPTTIELHSTREQLSPRERRNLFELRCDEILFNHETTDPFAAELKAICSKLSPSHSSGVIYDDEAQFQSFMTSLADSGAWDKDLEDLMESHERVTEQYSEGGVVSLHMSDTERFVVDGTLEDDVTEEYLPPEAAALANDIRQLFINGKQLDIEAALNKIYGDPRDKSTHVIRTERYLTSATEEHSYTTSVYPNDEERQYVRDVLHILLEAMKHDFILNSMNSSPIFREFYNEIESSTDVRSLVSTIKRAYQARVKKSISIKMFTALNTLYNVKRSRLASTPVRITKTIDGRTRTFIPAIPVLEMAKTIKPCDLRQLATLMHTLPEQERERVSTTLQKERPALYRRIFNRHLELVETASKAKLRYLRWAFFRNRQTGQPHEADNGIHLLTAADTAVVWDSLKIR